ncbi:MULTISPECIES: C40 family peptidase [Brevibacillus]|jgi:Cell wall-associated hydrolases (invasion-associated proteins)|uniref:NlpC/P60 domain-containing protein n=1 Tax=Brevibacillus parabrevis TaxID=54914 RepID=A0A4Y3PUU3_BREPA|nr:MULTISPECIES: C40 family peptidase [Brevibacillus]MBU8714462.1 C40 family peptidase [Brevibacillus parabrevis]MDH6351318.1 lipoprotein Spr [Brevibacillus sp. 1238]MDR4998697.1 C40 family peptidase [Brevibacillus parabrevis]MED2254830.1 C40 family peptidase [Brevibacillus parabrevis]NRQ54389.1 C40 family peptidase [Brevibacillus sp. HD1.4A]
MKLRKTLIGIVMGLTLGVTAIALPMPGEQNVAHAAWTQAKADKVISTGKKYLGTPYKFGAKSSTTAVFDCSSFTQRVFRVAVGKSLPRTSRDQAKKGVSVSKANLKKGDLVFFKASTTTKSKRITHVAIYAGNNKILHTYGQPGVTFTAFKGTSWEKRFVSARRVL